MTRPNIVVIVADDLGFSDLGCFGGEIDTPNLDRLATRGVVMTSFYVTPRCSPSRAALLTGRHPHSVGVGILTSDDRPNGYPGSLTTAVPTIAESLKPLGYQTGLIGKWHLSSDIEQPNESWPTRRGFDSFYGFLAGCGSYFQPQLMRGEKLIPPSTYASEDYYITDDLSDAAIEFVQSAAASDAPFFLYLAHPAPHWPLHARERDIAKYRDAFGAGWDRLRRERFERQAASGLAFTQTLPPRDDEVPDWDAAADHEWEVERMAAYAAQVEAMDRGIGRLLDELDRLGISDDTLITFSSDNGACAEQLPEPTEWTLPEVICPPATRSGEPVTVGNIPGVMPGPENTYASYGRAWANLSNTPFRLYKRWVHEGGIASPFIAAWPSGSVYSDDPVATPGHIVDILPTILAAAGADPQPLAAGLSLLPLWQARVSDDSAVERPLFWEHVGNGAVRRGRWKLVREALCPWELYDIVADRGETNDLSADEPALVAELEALWHEWAGANGVIPWGDVRADYGRRGMLRAIDN